MTYQNRWFSRNFLRYCINLTWCSKFDGIVGGCFLIEHERVRGKREKKKRWTYKRNRELQCKLAMRMMNPCWVNVIKVKAGLMIRIHTIYVYIHIYVQRKRVRERSANKATRQRRNMNSKSFSRPHSTGEILVASPGDVNAEAFLILVVVCCSLFKIQSPKSFSP